MYYYIESQNTDPQYNLALEQWVFDRLDTRQSYCMLWQNFNSVIVGKHQNTMAEINSAFVKEHNISVVRRLSGGGAVYHDLGNLNFTFIGDTGHNGPDFAALCRPIQAALLSLGIPAEISGRNDITINGKKISGNAMYVKKSRIMHHGTLLYDSNLEMLTNVLNLTNDKKLTNVQNDTNVTIESRGIKSVQSRVTNIRPYMQKDMPVNDFWAALKAYIMSEFEMREYILSETELAEADSIKEKIYSQWDWNYGASPAHNIRKTRRIENCGSIEVLLDVGKEGKLNNVHFYGDFFSTEDIAELSDLLTGHKLEYNEIEAVINDIEISKYFHNLDNKTFLSLLFE